MELGYEAILCPTRDALDLVHAAAYDAALLSVAPLNPLVPLIAKHLKASGKPFALLADAARFLPPDMAEVPTLELPYHLIELKIALRELT